MAVPPGSPCLLLWLGAGAENAAPIKNCWQALPEAHSMSQGCYWRVSWPGWSAEEALSMRHNRLPASAMPLLALHVGELDPSHPETPCC